VARSATPPTPLDVRLIGKSPSAFSLSGFERVEGMQYAQSWLVQATAYRVAPGDHFRQCRFQ